MTQDEITALLARILPGGVGQLQQQPGAPVLNGWPDHTAGGLTGRFTPAVFRGPAPEPTSLAFRPGMDDPEVIMAAVRGQGGAPGGPPAPAGGPMPGLSRNPYDVQRTPRPSLAGYGPLQGAEPSSGAFSPLPQAADQMASMPPEQASGEMFGKIPMPPEFAGQTIGLGPDGFYSSGGAPTGSAMATNDAPQPAPRRSFLPDDFRNRVEDMLMGWAAGADGGVQGSLAMGGKMMAAGKLSRKEKADLAKSGNKTLEWAISKGMDPAEAQAVMEGVGPKGLIEYVQEASKGQKAPEAKVETIYDPKTGREMKVRMYPDGTYEPIGGVKAPSDPLVSNVIGGGDKGDEALAKAQGEMFSSLVTDGLKAGADMARIDRLDGILSNAPQGGLGAIKQFAGEFGLNTEGLSDIQAAQAVINAMVPEMRAPGSGPMSDRDLELFKASLPRIINQPNANALIINTLRGITEYRRKQGEIAMAVATNQIPRAQALKMLYELENPLAEFNQILNAGNTAQADLKKKYGLE